MEAKVNEMYQAYLEMWTEEYVRARQSGLKHTPARNQTAAKMKQVSPEVNEVLEVGMASRFLKGDKSSINPEAREFGSKFGPMVQKLRRQMDNESAGIAKTDDSVKEAHPLQAPTTAADNGSNGDKTPRVFPGLATYPSGKSNVSKTILDMLLALNPKPGDVIYFGNLRAWGIVCGFSDYAVPNLVMGVGGATALNRAGFYFEVIDKSICKFAARVTDVPQTERDREIAELEKKQAELAAMIAALKNGK